ncbi:MAG TPA: GNAT family N-acetyltransferase [Rhodospirillaceae bacterium]|nr:GNAT family N-acetyltransferase [Rhodospirillaceae bacterium]HAT35318.1 GNAT family N-acetyltransferase [Rhodospirillaceae bacterium]
MEVKPVTLTGTTVSLEPMTGEHSEGLFAAAQDEDIWPFTAGGSGEDEYGEWFDEAMRQQHAAESLIFAVRLVADGQLVGSTRYMNIAATDRRLEIGSTWYNSSVWGGKVNPECKLLLMTHAFEKLGCYRVEYRCDARNRRSRAAILKLGATEEGILRRHKRTRDDFWRDTIQFSILDSEWPAVKAGLETRLD